MDIVSRTLYWNDMKWLPPEKINMSPEMGAFQ